MSGPPGGASIGRALSALLSDTMSRHKAASIPIEAASRRAFTRSMMEEMEGEMAEIARHVFDDALADPEVPETAKALLRLLTEPSHQVSFIVQLIALPLAIMGVAGAIEAGTVDQTAARSRHQTPGVHLSPELLAEAVLKGVADTNTAADEARYSGVTADRFGVMVGAAGEPIGLQEMLEAYRRGIIDEARLQHGIRQSRVRNEWTDVIEALRFAPMSPASAIEAAVQSHLTIEQARAIAAEGGLFPAHFDPLYETAGSPPGIQEMLELWNRGIATEGQVDQAIRESRVKNKYVPLIKAARRRLPPERTVVSMVHQGVLDAPGGIAKLLDLGFSPEDAALLVQEGLNTKKAADRDLAKGEIVTLYEDGTIDAAKAGAMLGKLHYDAEETGFLLELADHRRERQYTQALITRVHARYVSFKLDRSEASAQLDAAHVPTPARDQIIRLWDLERASNIPTLTVAQLEGLVRREALDPDEFLVRVQQLGYTLDDAQALLVLAEPAPRAKKGA